MCRCFCIVFWLTQHLMRSLFSFLFFLLFLMYLFLCLLLRVLFIARFQQFDYNIPWCCFLLVSSKWSLLSFLTPWICSFHRIWKKRICEYSFRCYFCCLLFLFFSEILVTHKLSHFILYHCLLVYVVFQSFSSFFILDNFYCYFYNVINH